MKNNSLKAPKVPTDAFHFAVQFDTEVKNRMKNLSIKFFALVRECKDGNPGRILDNAINEEMERLGKLQTQDLTSDDYLDLAAITLFSIREGIIPVLRREERADNFGIQY